MPNWCNNSIHVNVDFTEEKRKELTSFINELIEKGKEDIFNEFVAPLGQEWDYNLACEKWGTKWDVSDFDIEIDINDLKDCTTVHFDIHYSTAWGPNIPVSEELYKKLCEFGEVEYEHLYDEPGMSFYGKFDGVEDQYYDQDIYYRIKDYDLDDYELNKIENNIITFKDLAGFFLIKSREEITCNFYEEEVILDRFICFSETYGDQIEVIKTKENRYYLPYI